MKILKMQQGGMITAPNPQPYRVPLAGLNADAFRYNLSTSPLDTSGMVQVLQFQEGADLRRQQQAMELEKKRIEKEIAEAKLDFQNKKLAFDLIKDINKASKSVGGGTLDLNGNPFNPDLTNTVYFKEKYKKPLEEISQLQSEIDKLSVELTPENAVQIQSLVNKIATLRQNMGTQTDLQVETLIGKKLQDWYSGSAGKGERINPFVLQSVKERRDRTLNNIYATDYAPGNPANIPSYLVVNEANEKEKFDNLVTSVLSSFSTDDVDFKTYGDTGNAIVKTTTKKMVFDNKTALNNLAEKIINDKSLASYLSLNYGVNLFRELPFVPSNDPTNPQTSRQGYAGDMLEVDANLVKKLLESNVGPLFDAEEGKTKGKEQSVQIAGGGNKKTTIEYTGGASSKKDINVNKRDIKSDDEDLQKDISKVNDNEFVSPKLKDVVQSVVDSGVDSPEKNSVVKGFGRLNEEQAEILNDFIEDIESSGFSSESPIFWEFISKFFRNGTFNSKKFLDDYDKNLTDLTEMFEEEARRRQNAGFDLLDPLYAAGVIDKPRPSTNIKVPTVKPSPSVGVLDSEKSIRKGSNNSSEGFRKFLKKK